MIWYSAGVVVFAAFILFAGGRDEARHWSGASWLKIALTSLFWLPVLVICVVGVVALRFSPQGTEDQRAARNSDFRKAVAP